MSLSSTIRTRAAVAELFNQCTRSCSPAALPLRDQVSRTNSRTASWTRRSSLLGRCSPPLAEILTELPAFAKYDPKKLRDRRPRFRAGRRRGAVPQSRADLEPLSGADRRAGPRVPPADRAPRRTAAGPQLVCSGDGQGRPGQAAVGLGAAARSVAEAAEPEVRGGAARPRGAVETAPAEGTTSWPRNRAKNIAAGHRTSTSSGAASYPWLRLYYLRQNMERIALDWKSNWLNVGLT